MKSSASLLCLIRTKFDHQKNRGTSDQFSAFKGVLAFFFCSNLYVRVALLIGFKPFYLLSLKSNKPVFFSSIDISKGKVDAQHFLKECTSGVLGDAAVHVSELVLP